MCQVSFGLTHFLPKVKHFREKAVFSSRFDRKIEVCSPSAADAYEIIKHYLKDKKVEFGTFGVRKLVPNATLVISTFELDEIRKRTGVDLHDVHFAKKLIQQLFLLTFIIVDEGSETIEILYESSSAFETYALETLEREISMNSNKLGKEIGRMISK